MGHDAQQVADQMTCAIAHLLEDGQTVFHGVSSHLPMVAMLLAKQMHAPNMIHLDIAGGVNPKTAKGDDFSSAGPGIYQTGESFFSLSDVFDLSMRGGLDVAFLSGVQFDAFGNVNASVIGDYNKPKVRLPGGAGSAVLIPTAKRVILWRSKHDKRTFVETMDFITTCGNTWRFVTPLCVLAFENEMWKLESVHPYSSKEEVVENTGFALNSKDAGVTAKPTSKELAKLKQIDPQNFRLMEFE